ncbi:MAG TPA: hypothetical protein VHE57_14645 [Mycobacteriales bacterium]|nr:hypothetical protein [Mycobacteriales bacterium]
MPRRQILPVAGLMLAFVAGCSSGSSDRAATTAPSLAACPAPPTTGDPFPSVPAARPPHPDFAQSPHRLPTDVKGDSEVQFTTAMPLRDAAAFVHTEYAAAGYRIVGGDAEAHEADIVWAHGDTRGKTRLSQAGVCSTTWTVLTLR